VSLVAHLRDRIRQGGSTPMRGSREIRTSLRSLHLICIAALYGGHVFGVEKERLLPALIAVFVSGGLFALFEIFRSPIWLVQLRGVATYLKIAMVISVELFWDWRVAILSVVIVLGTFVSHMPGSLRYYSLLHGREVRGGELG